MRRDLVERAIRMLWIGVAFAGALVVSGFVWFVTISWDVLQEAIGFAPLVALLSVAAAVPVVWGPVVVSRVRRSASSASGWRRAGVAAVSLLAAVSGVVAVPTTRARLETNKCHRVAAGDALSQAACHSWLQSRRQWWTLGLSHKDRRTR